MPWTSIRKEKVSPEKWQEYLESRRERTRKYKAANHEKFKTYHRKYKMRMRHKKQAQLAGRARPGKCEICDNPGRICFDHYHSRGQFRGWLCAHCNSAIGYARDNAAILRKLAEYLEVGYSVDEAPSKIAPVVSQPVVEPAAAKDESGVAPKSEDGPREEGQQSAQAPARSFPKW